MRYFLVVGEASADLHASRLITAIRRLDPKAQFAFMGGDLMAQASGVSPLMHYREVAFMGLIPVLRNLGTIRRAGRQVQEEIKRFRPDVVIPIDFAGFNFRYVLPFVSKHLPTCPIVYYIAPKLWAWKPWRIRTLRRYVTELLVILPFEEEYFSSRGVRTLYVGNPSADATRELRLNPLRRKAQIALLSGSRRQELASNLPTMLESVRPYARDFKLVIAGAPGLSSEDYQPYLSNYPDLGVELRFGDTFGVIAESAVALVTSGTATLETALLGTPQVVLYRMGGNRLARWGFDTFFSVPYISLVNLILGHEAVPELIGSEVKPQSIQKHLEGLLLEGSPEREKQLQAIEELRQKLGEEPTSELSAKAIIQLIQ